VVDGITTTFAYNADNKLTTVSRGGSTIATFVYDGDGTRVSATINGVTTKFVGDSYEITGTTVTKYYGGSAMRVDGTLYYLLSDHLGSNSLILDTAGNVVGETRYTAWGEERYSSGTVSTDYTYTGQYSNTDDFGLMYYKARWYDPQLGRFAQADSIVPGAGNPISWDRYAYVKNNPIVFFDPTGHVNCADTPTYYGIQAACIIQTTTSTQYMKSVIADKFGVALTDSANMSWSIANLRTIYNGLNIINGSVNGNLKTMLQDAEYQILGGGNQYYGWTKSNGTIEYHVADSNTVLPLINILHETGHLLDVREGNTFSGGISDTPIWVDSNGYVDRDVLLNMFSQPVQAAPLGESWDTDEYWADAFANTVVGNVNLTDPVGQAMADFVNNSLAPYMGN
jgi:RHS repeat-associated protein